MGVRVFALRLERDLERDLGRDDSLWPTLVLGLCGSASSRRRRGDGEGFEDFIRLRSFVDAEAAPGIIDARARY